MNKRTAKYIALGLAADLLNSELSNQAMFSDLPYTEAEIMKVHDALEEISNELDRRSGRDHTDAYGDYLDEQRAFYDDTLAYADGLANDLK